MTAKFLSSRAAAGIVLSCVVFYACSKDDGDDGGGTPPPDACASVTVTATANTGSEACSPTGTLTAAGAGGTGFTYKLDDGAFQSGADFTGVAAGEHTVTAKTSTGCEKSVKVTIAKADPGPLFASVKALVAANCQGCHNASNANGGMDWTVECNLITNKARIKARAVDGIPSFMPKGGELSQDDKNKITAWIDAGGGYAN